jgi:phosphate:Na+ symporter
MGDVVETMLQQVMIALMTNDRALAAEVSRMDNIVDRLDEAIKMYVTKLTRGSLDEHEGRRATEIISFVINLEHIGDIIDKNLSEVATKKIRRKLQFSAEGATELTAFHKRVLESLKSAFGVFMSGDVVEARKLIAAKAELRSAELIAAERHLERLREGRPESLETTSLHLTCCAISNASTRTSARSRTRCSKRRARCRRAMLPSPILLQLHRPE